MEIDLQSIFDYLLSGSGVLAILLSVVEFSPIKINPWTAIAKKLGKALNEDTLHAVEDLRADFESFKQEVRNNNVDRWISLILSFNSSLIQGVKHTQEDWIEILKIIQKYKRYCEDHKEYENGRAVHAIANIERTYDTLLQEHAFHVE